MANIFTVPPCIVAGRGALELAREQLSGLGRRALIVTDGVMVQLGNVEKVAGVLRSAGVAYVVYDAVSGEPDHGMIDRGVEVYQENGCDFLIAVGGGSPIDSMKAIAAVAANGGGICSYVGKALDVPLPPMCAIPTTAGTGSEATSVAIITNLNTNVKMMIKHPALMVRLAIVDPEFTRSAPPPVTAATGIDALCHAVESYTSRQAFSMSDVYAVSAVQRIFKNLYAAWSDGSNLGAREEMAVAALEAGISFSNSSVTLIHGMSRPIGALFHIPHGLSNAVLLDRCLNFAVSGAYPRFCHLAEAVGLYRTGMTEEEGAAAFLAAVHGLCESLEIPTLAALGVDRAEFFSNLGKMANDALASGSPANTWRIPTAEDLISLYRSLWD